MSITQKIKEFISPMGEEEFVEYEEEEVESLTDYESPKSNAVSSLNASTKMVLFEPRSFEEVDEIGKRIKEC